MEAYKTICPDCGHAQFWTGYKTGLGKTPEQLQAMRERERTCVRCGSKRANTDLDRESETGKMFDEMDQIAAQHIGNLITEMMWKKMTILEVLIEAEKELPKLLVDSSRWNSLFVDYHAPLVERLWCDWNGHRISLHRIHPCTREEALFHPHPWPQAVHILTGHYEMGVGYGKGEIKPPIAAITYLGPGAAYEMTDPNGWHYVRPIEKPVLSIMVTGKPWDRPSPKSDKILLPLSEEKKTELINLFRSTIKAN